MLVNNESEDFKEKSVGLVNIEIFKGFHFAQNKRPHDTVNVLVQNGILIADIEEDDDKDDGGIDNHIPLLLSRNEYEKKERNSNQVSAVQSSFSSFKYTCTLCYYDTNVSCNYDNHCNSTKHKMAYLMAASTDITILPPFLMQSTYECQACNYETINLSHFNLILNHIFITQHLVVMKRILIK